MGRTPPRTPTPRSPRTPRAGSDYHADRTAWARAQDRADLLPTLQAAAALALIVAAFAAATLR